MKLSRFLEVILLFGVSFLLNYLIDEKDLLYLNTPINIYLYALVIIALFYGFLTAFIFYLLYFGVQYLLYADVNLYTLSHYFIFLSIFSEFMYFWNKRIEKLKEENSYFKSRVEKLGTAYYLLKTSHDELEKSYILKPFSIREILRETNRVAKESPQESMKLFLTLLKKLFKIEKATLFFKEGDQFVLKGFIGEEEPLDTDDILVKSSLEHYTMTHVVNMHNQQSHYLAVIPIVSLEDELKGLFVIKEMPFFSLTKDNLITTSLLLTYFVNSIKVIDQFQEYSIDASMAHEITKLHFLSKKYKISNHLIIFETQSEVDKLKIEKLLRGVDISFKYQERLIVLLPFTPSVGVVKFVNRVTKEMEVRHSILDLSQNSLEDIQKVFDALSLH
ncbi:MAG: hypothetical protein DSY46_04735 [Hydrogenimonas sp.]|nr:MAG: hypothetical protein DSY46_04735 [Hydrogenimonas sp.]